MSSDHYILPADDGYSRCINFSGGRSSGFMLNNILDAHDRRLPNSAVVCFANTGKERPETLDYVHRLETEWSVPIVWLEYRYKPTAAGGAKDPRHCHVVVDYESASRDGRPFEELIRASSILPNVAMRKCSSEMKVRTVSRFLRRDLGWRNKDTRNIIGFRHDEPKRWMKAQMEHCTSEFPMVHAKATKADVDQFWRGHPLDLQIDSTFGNCDLCFLKGKAKLLSILRRYPEWAAWWIEQEAQVLKTQGRRVRKSEMAQFSQRYTYAQLLSEAIDEPEFPMLADDEEVIDCFCGD